MDNKLIIGSDHAGFELKEKVKKYLLEKGWKFTDVGTTSEESTDYPDYAHSLAENISLGTDSIGILICGSANGVSITANKHIGVRAAIAWNQEVAKLAREHNDANVLSLPARYISESDAMDIVDVFLETDFEGGRHARRVNKINIKEIEKI
ncbi:MAG: ribose 5-phosphate isomerase B [Ulvibacter sp.]|jgi:ribose 5-phosphate isomerase B